MSVSSKGATLLFHSVPFLFGFLPLCLIVFKLLQRAGQATVSEWWLIVCSVFFYAQFVPIHALLFLISIIVNFSVGRVLADRPSKKILACGVAFNLSILAVFKYTGFVIANVNALFDASIPDPGIVLPLALSFFSFQKIAYIVDVYRGGAPRYTFTDFLLFVLFFPQLIAGPIVHHADVMPQIKALRTRSAVTDTWLPIGIMAFCLGLFKKLGVADSVAVYADLAFDAAKAHHSVDLIEAWLSVIAYTCQIYFDFSGYSDMAVGLGYMFGVRLPANFLSPYKATSVIDFWRRWHITLSAFLKDYLYFPLGGNRMGELRRTANLWIVMVLGGLWHGASWTFVAWGGLHALYLSVNHVWRRAVPTAFGSGPFGRAAGWGLTLLSVMIAWVFFRAADFGSAWSILKSMAGFNGIVLPQNAAHLSATMPGIIHVLHVSFGGVGYLLVGSGSLAGLVWIPVAVFVALCCPNVPQWLELLPIRGKVWRQFAFQPGWQWAVIGFSLAAGSLLWQANTARFLYFQF